MSETAIALSPLGEVEGDLENQFIQFYFDCKKQTSTASSDILTMEYRPLLSMLSAGS